MIKVVAVVISGSSVCGAGEAAREFRPVGPGDEVRELGRLETGDLEPGVVVPLGAAIFFAFLTRAPQDSEKPPREEPPPNNAWALMAWF